MSGVFRCDRLRPGEVCHPHRHIPVWRRIIASGFGALMVTAGPIAARVQAGAGIQEVQAVIFGAGLLFVLAGVGGVTMASMMDEDHLYKYFFTGTEFPGIALAISLAAQLLHT